MRKPWAKYIEDAVYGKSFTLIVGCEHDKLSVYLKRKHAPELVDDALNIFVGEVAFGVFTHIDTSAYVWLREFSWTIDDHRRLVHELSHLVDAALDMSGIKLDWDNTEVRAYYMAYVYGNVLKALQRFHPEGKKRK